MLESFSIKNYRGLRDLEFSELDRINLIAGANNVGKSAVLEALYLIHRPTLLGPYPISIHRGLENLHSDVELTTLWGWLFYGKDFRKIIQLQSTDNSERVCRLTMAWEYADGAKVHKVRSARPDAINPDVLQMKYVDAAGHTYVSSISKHRPYESNIPDTSWLPLGVLVCNQSRRAKDDVVWFSKLDDMGRQGELVSTLQLIDPRVQQLAVSVSDGIPMVYADIGIGRRIPLSQMGEGMTRLLSIVLEIASAAGGVILIDEIENGLHHSVLVKVWRAIADASRRADTQVFATTHSLEAIRAAYLAFTGDHASDLRLHRLERSNGEVSVVTYNETTLETSMELNLEVR